MYHQIFNTKNSKFCSQSAFPCFSRISEQTTIIFLYTINRLVDITETEYLLHGAN